MEKTLKILRRTFLAVSITFVLWLIGLFAQLPVIPFIETNYLLSETNDILSKGIELGRTDKLIIKLEIPDYYPEKDQCFDTWFSSRSGQHTLTVSDFSITVFDRNDSEISKQNSYLFWDNGSKDEAFKIENYVIAKLDTTFHNKYVFFRSVYNMADGKEFKVQIKANFILDGVNSDLDKRLSITKRHRLTWNKLRAH
mgnify:FL=1